MESLAYYFPSVRARSGGAAHPLGRRRSCRSVSRRRTSQEGSRQRRSASGRASTSAQRRAVACGLIQGVLVLMPHLIGDPHVSCRRVPALFVLVAAASLASLVSCRRHPADRRTKPSSRHSRRTWRRSTSTSPAPRTPRSVSSTRDGPAKHAAWAFMRHNTGPKNQIRGSSHRRAVTINSIGQSQPGQNPFPSIR